MAAALRAGKLTRPQFEAWYSRRTVQGSDLMFNLRDLTARLLEPVAAVLEQNGRRVLDSVATQPARRSYRRRTIRASARRAARRA